MTEWLNWTERWTEIFTSFSFLTFTVKVVQPCPTLCDPVDYTTHGILQARILGVGSLSLLQGIFPIKKSNLGLPHYGWILYQLSHKGSPRILGWIAYHFSRGSSQPRNQTGVSCIADGFFTNWAIREAKNLTLVVCFLLLLKRERERENVWHLQPISSIWRP